MDQKINTNHTIIVEPTWYENVDISPILNIQSEIKDYIMGTSYVQKNFLVSSIYYKQRH